MLRADVQAGDARVPAGLLQMRLEGEPPQLRARLTSAVRVDEPWCRSAWRSGARAASRVSSWPCWSRRPPSACPSCRPRRLQSCRRSSRPGARLYRHLHRRLRPRCNRAAPYPRHRARRGPPRHRPPGPCAQRALNGRLQPASRPRARSPCAWMRRILQPPARA